MTVFTRLFDILPFQLSKQNIPDCLAGKEGPPGQKQWKKYSTADAIQIIDQVAAGLIRLGIQKDQTVAIISNNRPEWNFLDLGIQQAGAINVPVYPTITQDEYRFIFNHAEVQYIFVSDNELLDKIQPLAPEIASLKGIFTFDKMEGAKHWSELLQPLTEADKRQLEATKSAISPEDLATIIYTSGTTGTPKGVMLTHNNLISNIKATMQIIPLDFGKRALSFLPLCHSFERMVIYTYMAVGMSIYYAESLDTIGDNLKEVKPNFFTTVPRLLEKVYEKIVAKGHELTGFKKRLFFLALDLGHRYELNTKQGLGYNLQLTLVRKLVFSKWKEALGGNIEGIVTGAAALQPRLGKVFTAAGIPIMEGYGLTETSPVIAVNRLQETDRCIGTVGLPIPGIEVKLADDGEILCKGPNIMKGYFRRQDLTDEVITPDGWFHTGDIGQWVDGKFLQITDRKKELFKTSGGKYVAPQPIENRFKEHPLIEQIAVIGDDRKFVSALIVPSFMNLREWCARKNIPLATNNDLIQNPKVQAEFNRIVSEINQNINKVEQVKEFRLLPDEWSIDTGELTPTMKLKRKIINEKYKAQIQDMYKV